MARRAGELEAECGLPVRRRGQEDGECVLPAGHRETWCQDARALAALERLQTVQFNLDRAATLLAAFGLINYSEREEAHRETWAVVWSCG